MAILRAYGDESGDATDPKITSFSMAAIIGTIEQWQTFEGLWGQMLKEHEIPHLHMKEVWGARQKEGSIFAKFANVDELRRLLLDAVKCIAEADLMCHSNAVYVKDLKRVLKRHKLKVQPYSFGLHLIVVTLGTWALNQHRYTPAFHLVMDRMQRSGTLLDEAEEFYNSSIFLRWRGWPAVSILPWKGGQGFSDMPELQAADLVAWLARRQLDYIGDWMREHRPSGSPDIWVPKMVPWLTDRVNQHRETFPEGVVFMTAWSYLLQRCLNFSSYNEEMLEEMLPKRDRACDGMLMARTIADAGPFPLTP